MFRPTFEFLENRDLFSVNPLGNMPTPNERPLEAATAVSRTETVDNNETITIHGRVDWAVDYTHPDLCKAAAGGLALNERFDSRTLPSVDGVMLEFAGYLDDTDIVLIFRSPMQAPAAQALFAGRYGDGRFAGFVNTTFDDQAAVAARTESIGKDEKISIGGNRTESARLTDTDGDGLITFLRVATGDVNNDGRADVILRARCNDGSPGVF